MSGQNKLVTTPDLMALLNLFKKDILLTINCHAIGTIQSFDSDAQTAKVSVNYKKTFYEGVTLSNPVFKDYPVLIDIPVVVLGGGNSHLTFPIAQGDECLIFFNDRDIDNWFSSGQTGPLATLRMHSFADGIALVGVNSLLKSLENYDMTRAVLAFGTTLIAVSASKVKIANGTTTLNTLLQSLITDLNTLLTSLISAFGAPTLAPGSPLSAAGAAAATSAKASLTTLGTQIGGLLE